MDDTFLIALASDCPFCGANSNNLETVESLKGWGNVVKCLACEAFGPSASNPELATAEWNRRMHRIVTIGSSASSGMAE